ncbi:hypothetical protein Syun_001045 [Stephania yunnanensis]|uniref:Uncharacterized protein n=1 Tax=Stephania yunnanensis TaxID=152371 RepID=A0AAP0LE17_9MAGN
MSMPRHRPVTATSPTGLNKLSATAAGRHRELLDRVFSVAPSVAASRRRRSRAISTIYNQI